MRNIKKILTLFVSIIFIGLGSLGKAGLFQLFMTMIGASLIAYLFYDECCCDEGGLSIKVIAFTIIGYFIVLVLPVYYFADKSLVKMWWLDKFFRERRIVIMTIFVMLLICGAIKIMMVYHKEYVQKVLLIMCTIFISVSWWQNSKMYVAKLDTEYEKRVNITNYNQLFRKVRSNVMENNIEAAIQGLEDMYILGEQINYTVGTNKAQELPLYLREVLTGERGKMLNEREQKQIAYANVSETDRIKYFLAITTNEDGNIITERSSEQEDKTLWQVDDRFIIDLPGGKKWIKDEVRDFKLNMDEAMQRTMKVLQANKRYKECIIATTWATHLE